ncbi:APC family permease [Brachybacterium sp. EF45031]|uniref:APC family permease n=1 Tax=Brachybacterium sillae TaxID=2810536 RepID=UPI00217D082A|nr:APC family permease [Brachybacterium sillae]MCS6710520.1 APC family permease [Brachybacterium sillae]
MPDVAPALKRVVLGRKYSSAQLARERLPVRIALPTFAADALSSVAYAPDEILVTLALAGVAAYAVSPWVALAVVVVLAVVVATNTNIIREYPGGGGEYAVVRRNLGGGAARVVGSALLVDYILTVAVSISQASAYAAGALPLVEQHQVPTALVLLAVLTVLNLRGVKQSGRLLAVPVYVFMGVVGLTLVVGAVQSMLGTLDTAPSAAYEIVPSPELDTGLTALGGALLVLRAFTSGCAALAGVEAISNGVPSFRPPKIRNASLTLLLLGTLSSALMLGIVLLARATGVQLVADPATQLRIDGAPATGLVQVPVIAQIAQAVYTPTGPMFFLVSAVTGVVLFLAAHTAFNGFPNLASVLARAGYLPRQLRVRGDRLAYSNGIVLLAVASALFIWATGASVTLLVQMYIVGVFLSFSLSQLGMVRHYQRRLRLSVRAGERRALAAGRVTSAVGFVLVTAVLVTVLVTKLLQGAWVALAVMALLFVLMTLVHRHYRAVDEELSLGDDFDAAGAHPSRSHALVVVASLDQPVMRALAVASAARHSSLQAVAVHDDTDPEALAERWRTVGVQIPLRIVHSPYREFARPVLAYVSTLLARNPRDVVVVYIPEFIVGHWWEAALHNHAARRLADRLTHLPRVVVTSVPWQLGSAQDVVGRTRTQSRTSVPTTKEVPR